MIADEERGSLRSRLSPDHDPEAEEPGAKPVEHAGESDREPAAKGQRDGLDRSEERDEQEKGSEAPRGPKDRSPGNQLSPVSWPASWLLRSKCRRYFLVTRSVFTRTQTSVVLNWSSTTAPSPMKPPRRR